MDRQIWIISDTHFSHENILLKTNEDGTPVRPEFSTIEQMNEFMINAWNERVQDHDIVYHLGDVGWKKKDMKEILPQLKGRKRLLLGNHDDFKMSFYQQFFQKIRVTREFGPVLLSHYPTMIDIDDHHGHKINVHGHIHGADAPSPQHINVSVEKTNYAPVRLIDVLPDEFKVYIPK